MANVARSSFAALPEELLDRIIYFTDSRPTLHALCLVSKNINRIATARLYAHIALTKDDFRHLRPLAVLLWTSAPHRNAVRTFSVRHAYGGNLDPWPQHPQLDDMIQEKIEEYVRERDKGQWFAQVRDGIDALPIASLLLRSLPHVAAMQFDGFMLVDPAARGSGRAVVWR
ncbi:hypothetical protein ACN47E_000721 [Coniothyrium glycines]